MLKNTHIEVGVSFYFIYLFFCLFHFNYFPVFPTLLLPILPLIPDMDHPESFINKKIKILKFFSRFGHRTWSHDLFTIFIIDIIIYFGLAFLFNYSDTRIYIFKDDYFSFIFKSLEFWGIYFLLIAHPFGDLQTKGVVHLFFWLEKIKDFFNSIKNKILKIILLPLNIVLTVFLKLFDTFNAIRANIFPKTGSFVEMNIYASIYNGINIFLLYMLLVEYKIHLIIEEVFKNKFLLENKIYVYVIILFCLVYFLGISIKRIKKHIYGLTIIIKNALLFVLFLAISIILSGGIGFLLINYINSIFIALFLFIVNAFIIVSLYKKYLKGYIHIANIIINEMLVLFFYLYFFYVIVF